MRIGAVWAGCLPSSFPWQTGPPLIPRQKKFCSLDSRTIRTSCCANAHYAVEATLGPAVWAGVLHLSQTLPPPPHHNPLRHTPNGVDSAHALPYLQLLNSRFLRWSPRAGRAGQARRPHPAVRQRALLRYAYQPKCGKSPQGGLRLASRRTFACTCARGLVELWGDCRNEPLGAMRSSLVRLRRAAHAHRCLSGLRCQAKITRGTPREGKPLTARVLHSTFLRGTVKGIFSGQDAGASRVFSENNSPHL